jgi:ADP-heptose:LPS heptosyltransferase
MKLIKRITSPIQRFRDIIRRELGILLLDRQKPKSFDLHHSKSILFIRNDAKLGDAIVSSGVIQKIRQCRPEIRILVMTTPSMSPFFKESFGIDDVIHLSKRPSYGEIRRVCQQLGEVDVAVSLNGDMKMKDIYLHQQLQSKANIGLDPRVKLVSHNISIDIAGRHYAKKFDYIATCLGISGEESPYIVPITAPSLAKVDDFLQTKEIERFVLLNPFGSGSTRKLNKTNIARIIQSVYQYDAALKVLILSAPETHSDIQAMALADNQTVFHFDLSRSIYDAIALAHRAECVISVDTAIVHIASGLRKPQIAIYKDDHINYQHWGPNSGLAQSVFTTKDINQLNIDDIDRSLRQLSGV